MNTDMDPSAPDASSRSLNKAPVPSFDAFTTFEHELAGLAAKLQRWSCHTADASSNGRSHGDVAMREANSRRDGPNGC